MSGQFAVAAIPATVRSDDGTERLAALFDAHHERLYRLARRLTPTADDARDLVQETFLRAAKSVRSVPGGREREEAWLVRVLVNIRRDEWRRSDVRSRFTSTRAPEPSRPDAVESSIIARRTIWQALDRLPPRRRVVVVMHELEGMTPTEVASLLGITAMTVRWHLSVGRRLLKRILKPYFGETR